MKLYFAPNTWAVRAAWLLNALGVAFEFERGGRELRKRRPRP